MSYKTYINYGYGICSKDFTEPELEKIMKLAAKSKGTMKKLKEYCKDQNRGMDTLSEEDISEVLDDSYAGGPPSLCVLKRVIWDLEKIDLCLCEDYDGRYYILFSPTYPWFKLNRRERRMTPEKLGEILRKYMAVMTEKRIEPDYLECENGG